MLFGQVLMAGLGLHYGTILKFKLVCNVLLSIKKKKLKTQIPCGDTRQLLKYCTGTVVLTQVRYL